MTTPDGHMPDTNAHVSPESTAPERRSLQSLANELAARLRDQQSQDEFFGHRYEWLLDRVRAATGETSHEAAVELIERNKQFLHSLDRAQRERDEARAELRELRRELTRLAVKTDGEGGL